MLKLIKKNNSLLILILIYSLSILIVSPYNSINNLIFPVNDEWYYALPIINFLDLKKIIIAEGMAAWSIPQIVIGYFFSKFYGFSFFNLRLIVISFSILNIFLIYFYLIKFLNFKKINTIILLYCFVFSPAVYFSNITFMSETFFFTFFLLSLIFIQNYKLKQNYLNLFFINLFILLLFLQRQIGILFIIYLFYIFNFQKNNLLFRKKEILYTCIFQFLSFLTFYFLISYHIGNTNPYSFNSLNTKNIFFIVYNIPQSFLYVGFLIIPYLLLTDIKNVSFHNNKKFYYSVAFLLIFAVLILFIKFGKLMPYFNNVFSIYGTFRLNEILPGERSLFFGKEFYYFLTILCLISILNFLRLISKNNLKTYFHLINHPLYFMSLIIFIFSLIMFKNFNDRYIYIFLFSSLVFFNSFFNYSINKSNKKLGSIFCIVIIFGLIFISVITARDMFRWSEASWTLTKKSIEKLNLSNFNVMAGHTWNWEKYRYISKNFNKTGFIKFSTIKELNDYNYTINFGKYPESIENISYSRMNKELFISLNKKK